MLTVCDTIKKSYRNHQTMPISLRLPVDIENQISGFSARAGLSKSAVILRSIREFLARQTAPTSLQIYQAAMQATLSEEAMDADARPHKHQTRGAIQKKHAERSARATKALKRMPKAR